MAESIKKSTYNKEIQYNYNKDVQDRYKAKCTQIAIRYGLNADDNSSK